MTAEKEFLDNVSDEDENKEENPEDRYQRLKNKLNETVEKYDNKRTKLNESHEGKQIEIENITNTNESNIDHVYRYANR